MTGSICERVKCLVFYLVSVLSCQPCTFRRKIISTWDNKVPMLYQNMRLVSSWLLCHKKENWIPLKSHLVSPLPSTGTSIISEFSNFNEATARVKRTQNGTSSSRLRPEGLSIMCVTLPGRRSSLQPTCDFSFPRALTVPVADGKEKRLRTGLFVWLRLVYRDGCCRAERRHEKILLIIYWYVSTSALISQGRTPESVHLLFFYYHIFKLFLLNIFRGCCNYVLFF